jgi:hypothetical protein
MLTNETHVAKIKRGNIIAEINIIWERELQWE